MKRVFKLFIFLLLLSHFTLCNAQRYPTYFNSYWFNMCDNIVKGQEVGYVLVATIDSDSISAVIVKIEDSYGASLPDTICLFPDIENYFNRRGRINPECRDTFIELTYDDINFESGFWLNFHDGSHLQSVQTYYFRFRRENDQWVYGFGDNYFKVPVEDNQVRIWINNAHRFVGQFVKGNNWRYVPTSRFERKIIKSLKNNKN